MYNEPFLGQIFFKLYLFQLRRKLYNRCFYKFFFFFQVVRQRLTQKEVRSTRSKNTLKHSFLTNMLSVHLEAATTPKSAGCSPENRSVNLKDTDDPSLYYYPACTRVNRCGGCCGHDLLSCQPTKVEILNFEVRISEYYIITLN